MKIFSPRLTSSNFPTPVKDCSSPEQNPNKKLHNQKLKMEHNEYFWNLQINIFHIVRDPIIC